jgi:hypothetical protein
MPFMEHNQLMSFTEIKPRKSRGRQQFHLAKGQEEERVATGKIMQMQLFIFF